MDKIGFDVLCFDDVVDMFVIVKLDLFFVGLLNKFYLDYICFGLEVDVLYIFIEKFVVVLIVEMMELVWFLVKYGGVIWVMVGFVL